MDNFQLSHAISSFTVLGGKEKNFYICYQSIIYLFCEYDLEFYYFCCLFDEIIFKTNLTI